MLTQARLKELLHYCPKTGIFTWKKNRRGHAISGCPAGSCTTMRDGKSYVRIRVDGECFLAHRLAMLYMQSNFPKQEVDHIDGNGCNNIFTNLRCVSPQNNKRNKRLYTSNNSGCSGVTWKRTLGRWRSVIYVCSKQIHLGYYNHIEDAIAARKAAEVKYGFHGNHGSNRPL